MVHHLLGLSLLRKASQPRLEMARRSTRKSRRASTRRGRRSSRRCWSRRQRGGQAPVNDTSINAAKALSLAQGQDYEQIHANQHGGAAVSLASSAPVGYTGVLDDSLRATARIGGLDASLAEIRGMSDQAGGGRRRKARRGKGRSRRGRRGMRGGAQPVVPADYGSPGMLLSPGQEARALMGMNPEWKLAADPQSFAPRMQ